MIPSPRRVGSRVLTVTPNAAVDITYHVGGVRLGQTHRVQPGVDRAGGKGINVARVAYQQGYPVLAIAPIGGNSGFIFKTDLQQSGVPHRLIPVLAETRRTITLVDTRRDSSTIFSEPGGALQTSEWTALTQQIELSLNDRHGDTSITGALVGSGSLPANPPSGFYPTLIEMAHRHGIPAVIDTSGPGLIEAAQAGADLLKPNREEIKEATGISNPVLAARQLLDLGARRVLLSAGKDGMFAFAAESRSTYWSARLQHALQGNPTGAGDAAVAAAAVKLASGDDSLLTILRSATAWSAAAVPVPLAGEISPRHLLLEQQLIITETNTG